MAAAKLNNVDLNKTDLNMVAKYFHSVMKIGEDISKTQLRRFLILWECYSDETLDILDMKVAALYRELAKKRMGVQNMKQKEKSVVLQGITSLEEVGQLLRVFVSL
mmetsp:Transcript_54401/g.106446  ORF Transcript_54401/g.106446 Transcript_54401/m.106446 type:complete len:106 (+) Transcript_54401:232-549(+)